MKSLINPIYILVPALFFSACSTITTEPSDVKATAESQEKSSRAFLKKHKALAKQYHYAEVPEDTTVEEKKQRFETLLVPSVIKVYDELNAEYKRVAAWMENEKKNTKKTRSTKNTRKKIAVLKEEYRATTDQELLAALKPHPPSIVLAQAALESAWATSRFFVEARNVFGIWSFDENERRIAADEQRGDKTIWLKKYRTIEDAVRDNYRVLARGGNYSEFRKMRLNSSNPYELVHALDSYSEKGAKYGEMLASMIKFNNFTDFDDVKF